MIGENLKFLSVEVMPPNLQSKNDSCQFEVMDGDCRPYIFYLENKTCTCREFRVDQFICSHTVAACSIRGFSVYNYVSSFYKKEKLIATYAGVVDPLGQPSDWIIPDEI